MRKNDGHRRELGVLADAGAHLVAVEPGHHHVEHDRVGVQGVGLLEGFFAAERALDREPAQAEVDLEQPDDHGVVVDEQHAGRIGVASSPEDTRGSERSSIVLPEAAEGGGCRLPACRPRSSGDRAPASGAGSAGSNPAGGTVATVRFRPMTDPRDMRAPTGFHEDRPLDRDDLSDDPIALVPRLARRRRGGRRSPLPNAMAVATADAQGRPSVRHVLLRGVDGRGFVFFTNYESRKGRQLTENPWAALVFLWKELDRQVHVSGRSSGSSPAESDAYFATRPRDAQLGAWASHQSQARRIARSSRPGSRRRRQRFPGEVPRPPHWGGFRVRPEDDRVLAGPPPPPARPVPLHRRDGGGWRIDRLSP